MKLDLASLVFIFFLLQGTPPKPPRRQSGWAEESSSKWVPHAGAAPKDATVRCDLFGRYYALLMNTGAGEWA